MVTAVMATSIGERIVEARDARHWNQGQLAAYADVPRTWLSNVEVDTTKRPDPVYLLRVARALNTTLEYLLTGENPTVSDTDLGIVNVAPEKVQAIRSLNRRVLGLPPEHIYRLERTLGDLLSLGDAPAEADADDKAEE